MTGKKKTVNSHFKRRCSERVGTQLNEKEIIRKIQNNQLEFIERQSNRITIWRYKFEDATYRIVYDKERKQIVTVLYDVDDYNIFDKLTEEKV